MSKYLSPPRSAPRVYSRQRHKVRNFGWFHLPPPVHFYAVRNNLANAESGRETIRDEEMNYPAVVDLIQYPHLFGIREKHFALCATTRSTLSPESAGTVRPCPRGASRSRT